MLCWDWVNGAQGTPSDSSPFSTIFLQLSFTAPAVGGAGAEISPLYSLLFLMHCLVPDARPSSLKVSILELSANCFNTCPLFAPGMSYSLANFCQLIGGGAGGCCWRSRSTASLSQITVSNFGEWDFLVCFRLAGGVSKCSRLCFRLYPRMDSSSTRTAAGTNWFRDWLSLSRHFLYTALNFFFQYGRA